jgi:hypothetical protein
MHAKCLCLPLTLSFLLLLLLSLARCQCFYVGVCVSVNADAAVSRSYPEHGPTVRFTTAGGVFHPLVAVGAAATAPSTPNVKGSAAAAAAAAAAREAPVAGVVDLVPLLGTWQPYTHTIVRLLQALARMFREDVLSAPELDRCPNPEALTLYVAQGDRMGFCVCTCAYARVCVCVHVRMCMHTQHSTNGGVEEV